MKIKTATLRKMISELGKVAKNALGRPHLACLVVTAALGDLSLHATDGHRVSSYTIKLLEDPRSCRLAIPHARLSLVAELLKSHGKEISTEDFLQILRGFNEAEEVNPPALDKVIPILRRPTNSTTDTVFMNPAYLEAACKAARVVGIMVRVQHGADPLDPVRIDCETAGGSEKFIGVIMPMRG